MNDTPRIVGIGRCSFDLLGITHGFPKCDSKMELEAFSMQGGGPAATAMVACARLGFRTAIIGKVASDYLGDSMIAGLQEEGVDTAGIVRSRTGVSPFAFISVDRESGSRTIFWTHGSQELLLCPDEVDQSLVTGAAAIHVDGHHIAAAAETARYARQEGAIISYDAGTLRPGVQDIVVLSDLLVTTVPFAREYTGDSNLERAVRSLARFGARVTGVTLGADGCILYDGSALLRIPAFEVETVDTTGAGDVFHGALLAGYLRKLPLHDLGRFANAVAALKCTRLGGRPGIPTLEAVRTFLAGAHGHPPR